MLGRRRQKHQTKKLLFRRLIMQKINNLNRYLQDIAIISGKLRKTVLSKAGSQLTVSYLENGTLLRSSTNASS